MYLENLKTQYAVPLAHIIHNISAAELLAMYRVNLTQGTYYILVGRSPGPPILLLSYPF
jgi:hypothetical protein